MTIESGGQVVDVVIPTRDRPEKLRRCLAALAAAREVVPFRAFAVDSSTTAQMQEAVDRVCSEFPFAQVHRHERAGLAAARNECTRAGDAPLIASVDDDVYIAPDAIERLIDRYRLASGWRIVAGSVFWGEDGSGPVRMRRIGYGVSERDEAVADFYVTALILYPRALARQCPFNEHIRSSDDRFIGALWRAKHVQLLWESSAQARHDDEHNTGLQTAKHQDAHIYTNLFDGAFVRRSPAWVASVELLGFIAGAKLHCRTPQAAADYLRAWLRGNAQFVRDWRWLRRLANAPLKGDAPEV